MKDNLPQAIEAILLATAEPQTYAFLAATLSVDIEAIAYAVEELTTMLQGHGIVVTTLNEVVTLVTDSAYSHIIERIRKDELSKELSKASAETLATIIYTPGITKSQIEFIRGVNGSYTLRALQMRGLIEQKGRAYHPTLALLEHFGVSHISALPEYAATTAAIASLLAGEDASPESLV